MIVDARWILKPTPKAKPLTTRALEFILGASGILFFSFVTVCAVLGVAL